MSVENGLSFSSRVSLEDLQLADQLLASTLAEGISQRHLLGNETKDVDFERVKRRTAEEMLKTLTGDFNSFGQVQRKLDEGSLSEDEERRAREGLLRLEGAIFVVVDNNEEMTKLAIIDQRGLDRILPQPWRGMGQSLRERMIKDREVRGILGGLTRKRETRQNEGQMSRAFEKAIDDLDVLLERGENEDAAKASGFLNRELARVEGIRVPGRGQGGGQTESEERRRGIYGGIDTGLAGMMATGGKDVDKEHVASIASVKRAIEEVGPLSGNGRREIDEWMYKLVDSVGKESLFFAGGWQQILPYVEGSMSALGFDERRLSEEMARAKSKILCVHIREVIFHCDDDTNSFEQRLVPAALLPEYQWNSEMAGMIKADPVVDLFREWYVDGENAIAYSDRGDEIIKRLKGRKEMKKPESEWTVEEWAEQGKEKRERVREWAEELTDYVLESEEVKTLLEASCEKMEPGSWNEGVLKERFMMAISYFLVEDYPRWVSWALTNASNKNEEVVKEARWLEGLKTSLVRKSSKGEMREITSWSSDALGIKHPFVSLVRPVDLVRFKGGWDETILRPIERALVRLSVGKWDKGVVPTPSTVGQKDLARWNALWTAVIGNPRGDAIDDFEDLMKGFDKMVDLDPNRKNRDDYYGWIAGEIIWGKVLALTAGTRGSGYFDNIVKALAIETSSIPKEKAQAMAAMMDSGFQAEFGQIAEIMNRLSLKLGASPHYRSAIDKLVTEAGTQDPELMSRLARLRRWILGVAAVGNTFSEGGGKKKR